MVSFSSDGTVRLKLPYMPGLDGVRAIAVIAVIFYHANLPLSDGGYLGVEVFFVLSGYLITSLLLLDWLDDGKIAFGNFWMRRARRLLPALWLLLLIVPIWARFVAPDALPRLRTDVLAALTYSTNWVYILHKVSYFEQFGRPPLLRHLWSLAVEEQFYLLWPGTFALIMLAAGTPSKPRRTLQRFAAIAVALAAASALWRAHLYIPYEDPSRPYYGTDTRAAAILLGAALAACWMPHRLRFDESLRARTRLPAEILGWLGFVGLLVLFARLADYLPFLYHGGFLLTDGATLAVLVGVTHPDTLLGRLLGKNALRWIGLRSYGVYIWHWAIFASLRPNVDWPVGKIPSFLIETVLTFAVAEASYRWVEHPIRKQGFKAWWGKLRALGQRRKPLQHAFVGAVAFLLLLNVDSLAVFRMPAAVVAEEVVATPQVLPENLPTPTPRASPVAAATATPAPSPTLAMVASPTVVAPSPTPNSLPSGAPICTIIGDSVLQSAVTFKFFKPWGNQVYVDAKPGRKMRDLKKLIPELAQKHLLGAVVVIHIGTNYPFDPKTLDEVMEELLKRGVRRVFFVNVRRPVRWEDYVNGLIADGVKRWPQAALLDWHDLALKHPEWFVPDQTHLRYYGTKAYVQFIMQGIASSLGYPLPTVTPAP